MNEKVTPTAAAVKKARSMQGIKKEIETADTIMF